MGSALAGVMFVWSMLSPLLPRQLFEHFVGRFLRRHARRLAGLVDPYLTVTISEHCGERMKLGDVYEQAKAYLSHRCARRARSLRAERAARDGGGDRFLLTMGDGEEVYDVFQGATPVDAAKDESASKVTLSGLLNVIDGLWSACGGERIVVFTTNHVGKLDPALIRRGRMDKHIEMSYCCFETFKILAKNYLAIDAHHLFDDVRSLLQDARIKITPADVAEHLMRKCATAAADEAAACLASLVKALEKKAKGKETVEEEETVVDE
ncbi:hypothetical protein OsI_25231 [Oryza sativa Indica Group]|uniref:ATPase AAA-type core domain-containing protein n=1 Tax=Oryza sativa subsp. indica TaxID=39946 RepID=B8B854_ORYSI|nr:hypothetical protein OsI_25231 [Oryza sativa Indica Group]